MRPLTQNHKCPLGGTLVMWEKSESSKSLGVLSSEQHECLNKIMSKAAMYILTCWWRYMKKQASPGSLGFNPRDQTFLAIHSVLVESIQSGPTTN